MQMIENVLDNLEPKGLDGAIMPSEPGKEETTDEAAAREVPRDGGY